MTFVFSPALSVLHLRRLARLALGTFRHVREVMVGRDLAFKNGASVFLWLGMLGYGLPRAICNEIARGRCASSL